MNFTSNVKDYSTESYSGSILEQISKKKPNRSRSVSSGSIEVHKRDHTTEVLSITRSRSMQEFDFKSKIVPLDSFNSDVKIKLSPRFSPSIHSKKSNKSVSINNIIFSSNPEESESKVNQENEIQFPDKMIKLARNACVSHKADASQQVQKNIDWIRVEERLKNQETLCHIYYCLIRVVESRNLTLALDQYDCLSCTENSTDQIKDFRILVFLYTAIKKALNLKNFVFFNHEGSLISYQHLDELIQKKYVLSQSINQTIRFKVIQLMQKAFEKNRELINLAKSEKCTDDILLSKKMSDDNKLELKIKNSDYLNEDEKITSILQAKKEQFEELIQEMAFIFNYSKNETSYFYKIDALNFYKSRLLNYQFFLEFYRLWASNEMIKQNGIACATIKKELLEIPLTECIDSYMLRLSQEIKILSQGIKFPIQNPLDNPADVRQFLNINLLKIDNCEMDQFLDKVTSDMKIYAAQTLCTITYDSCVIFEKSRFFHESVQYLKGLGKFVYQNFDNILSKQSLSLNEKESKDLLLNFQNLYVLFVKMAFMLINKNDFHSSRAIHSVLKSVLIVEKIKKMPKLSRDIKKKVKFIFFTFNKESNYENMRKKVEECHLNKKFHVPYAKALCRSINSRVIRSFLKEKDNEIKNADQYFNELRSHLEFISEKYHFQTDIYYRIYFNTLNTFF